MTTTRWKHLSNFKSSAVRQLPYALQEKNKLIYCTTYHKFETKISGIFECDIKSDTHFQIKLWNTMNYFPGGVVSIYNKSQNCIMLIGGRNMNDVKKRMYQLIIVYNLTTKTSKQIHFKPIIGKNSQLILANNDNDLHIVGGDQSDCHYLYDIKTQNITSINVDSISNTIPNIINHGLIYNKKTNKIISFGGYSMKFYLDHDQYFVFDLNVMKRSEYLVSGYMSETFLKNNYNYQLELNNIILQYYGHDHLTNYCYWKQQKENKLPQKMSAFGHLLYDYRIIIIFGGRSCNTNIDNIYYMDLEGNESWQKSTLKCPKGGRCHAILVQNKTIHIIPNYSYSDHWCVDIADVLPSILLNKTD